MSTPNLWSPADLDIILGSYGAFIIERSGWFSLHRPSCQMTDFLSPGTDIEEALGSLRQYVDNIWVISQVIQNDVRLVDVHQTQLLGRMLTLPVLQLNQSPTIPCK
jgi:nicotinamide mononucleotide adenylyltransferase